jgi:hypothetical protein
MNGAEHSLIDYAKGGKILEYKDTDLIGVDFSALLPTKYKPIHRHGNAFKRFH